MRNHQLLLAFGLLSAAAGCVADAQSVLPPTANARTPEQRAVGAIKKAWGKVGVDKANPSQPVVSVDFHGVRVTGDNLDLLAALPNLREVNLYNTGLSDDSLDHLKTLAGLQTLNLCATRVTDAGLATLPRFPSCTRSTSTTTPSPTPAWPRSGRCPRSRIWTWWARA